MPPATSRAAASCTPSSTPCTGLARYARRAKERLHRQSSRDAALPLYLASDVAEEASTHEAFSRHFGRVFTLLETESVIEPSGGSVAARSAVRRRACGARRAWVLATAATTHSWVRILWAAACARSDRRSVRRSRSVAVARYGRAMQ